MKLSLEWIGRYVDISGLSPDEMAYKLTMATAEVEGVEKVSRSVAGVVVGEVTHIEPIKTGDSGKVMNYVTVNAGGNTTETVCGAPNVKVGMKSAFAKPGTKLSGGFVVKEQELYGKMSHGILCSPFELGWGESHAGIMAFQNSLESGVELSDFVNDTDYLIDIDNKSITHRPDLWGHYGFAREIAAVYKMNLKPLETADSALWENLDPVPLKIDDTEGCPGYCCLNIGGLVPAFSPMEMQALLLSAGLRPINLLVDLTNFIMLEIGQPMHAFEGDRVKDIIVAPFGEKGTFKTLDSTSRDMIPDDLMIYDHTGPVAIAGVMGGEESEIKESTSRVLLESANFHPARIRRTAVRLGLRTDASLRFEKGQPPYHMSLSIRRFVQLLKDAGQKPVIGSRLTCMGDMGISHRNLTLNTDYITKTIGMDIPQKEVTDILSSLGFGCESNDTDLSLTIPLHRSIRDISIPNDIVEEVARIYGYDNITPSLPAEEMVSYTFNAELRKQHKVRRFLSMSRGYTETHSYSWYDDNWLKKIGYEPGETLHIKNPAAENTSRMRRDLLPNLLSLIDSNSMHRDRFLLYEIGNIFIPVKNGRDQITSLAGIAYQSEKVGKLQDVFLEVKGTIENIFSVVDAEAPVFTPSKNYPNPWSVTGSCMDINLGKNCVGHIGYVTDREMKVYEKGTNIVWFELNLDSIAGRLFPEVKYEETPVYPGSWMDFSILADRSSTYLDIVDDLDKFTHAIMKKRKFIYSYDGKGVPAGMRSYTFRFWLGLKERTLTNEDLTDFRDAFLGYLENCGFSLR